MPSIKLRKVKPFGQYNMQNNIVSENKALIEGASNNEIDELAGKWINHAGDDGGLGMF